LPPKRPRALAVEIQDHAGELGRLHETLARAISEASTWTPEPRRFRAHVTLARLRSGARGARGSILARPELPVTPQLSFGAESITLYRSWLAPAGAVYEPLARARLAPV
jgi:RNA 2',3'-cyclic 3'-phosphodiesterase